MDSTETNNGIALQDGKPVKETEDLKTKSDSVSYYLLPFFVEKVDKYLKFLEKSNEWVEWYNSCRYLSGYIRDYFHAKEQAGNDQIKKKNKEKYVCRSYRFSKDKFLEYGLDKEFTIEASIINNQKIEGVSLTELIVYVFSTGVCFLKIGVTYDRNVKLPDIVDSNFFFSRMYLSANRMKIFSETVPDLKEFISKLIRFKGKFDMLPERKFLVSYNIVALEKIR